MLNCCVLHHGVVAVVEITLYVYSFDLYYVVNPGAYIPDEC